MFKAVAPPQHAIAAPYPNRPEMKTSTRHWVEDVRALATEATNAVLVSQDNRAVASGNRKQVRQVVAAKAAVVDAEAKRRVDKMQIAVKSLEHHIAKLQQETAELLVVRATATTVIDRSEKPLKDLMRRLAFRTGNVPLTEQVDDSVENDMRSGALELTATINALAAQRTAAEHHIAHITELRAALAADVHTRTAAMQLDAGFHHGNSVDALPKLENCTLPVSARAADPGRHKKTVQTVDTDKLTTLAAEAVGDGVLLRRRVKTAAKAVEVSVVANTRLVEESVKRKIADTKVLNVILADRLAMLRAELAAIEVQRVAVMSDTTALAAPLMTVRAKGNVRKAANKLVRDVNFNDELANASKDESAKLRQGMAQNRQQVAALDAQRARLEGLIQQLSEAQQGKQRLLLVDQRILEIGHTPAPPSMVSSRSRTTAHSRHTPRR
jgi:hypothetical protein